MAQTSSDVFLEPLDEFSVGSTGQGFGVVRIRANSSANIFSRDPDQLEALAEVCMDAARDLRIAQAGTKPAAEEDLNAWSASVALPQPCARTVDLLEHDPTVSP